MDVLNDNLLYILMRYIKPNIHLRLSSLRFAYMGNAYPNALKCSKYDLLSSLSLFKKAYELDIIQLYPYSNLKWEENFEYTKRILKNNNLEMLKWAYRKGFPFPIKNEVDVSSLKNEIKEWLISMKFDIMS